ncbi:phage portal protein [Glaciibacter flavus]|uniref:phage portal protein n=1 Tax=Orlajensenia flava TaxID=2565934 RepID=UPI003AFF70C6
MGILQWLVGGKQPDYSAVDIGASPWATTELTSVGAELFNGIFPDGFAELPMTRAGAMTIPAVVKGRNLLVSTIAKFPLKALDKNGEIADQPTWLYREDDSLSTYDRIAATVDDMIFFGRSLWTVLRGADGRILNATWCPMDRWNITDGNVLVDEKPISDQSYILFHMPLFDGLLAHASRTLRGARDTELSWVDKMRNPIPAVEFRITDDGNLTQAEVDALRTAFDARTRAGEGATVVTPQGVEIVAHGSVDPTLYTEGRNAIRTDIGSFLNVRAAMLDGTIGIDSLTYTTTEGTRNLFYEIDLPFWTNAIEAALSVDSVVPRGQRVRFDMYAAYNIPPATGVPTED